LSSKYNGITHHLKPFNAWLKLTATEEQMIIQCILNLDLQGFTPWLCKVEDMADKVLGVHGGEPVGKHWAERFVMHSDELKMAFN
jgi:hypothetical protein